MRFINRIFEQTLVRVLSQIIATLLISAIPVLSTSVISKFKTGSWTKLFLQIPPITAFGALIILPVLSWIAIRIIKVKRYNRPKDPGAVWIPPHGWRPIRYYLYSDVLWLVKIPEASDFDVLRFRGIDNYMASIKDTEVTVDLEGYCPKCKTELTEQLRFFKRYLWKCLKCDFEKKSDKPFKDIRPNVLKLVRSDWRNNRSLPLR